MQKMRYNCIVHSELFVLRLHRRKGNGLHTNIVQLCLDIQYFRRNAFQVREISNEFILFFIYLQFRNSIIRVDAELMLFYTGSDSVPVCLSGRALHQRPARAWAVSDESIPDEIYSFFNHADGLETF